MHESDQSGAATDLSAALEDLPPLDIEVIPEDVQTSSGTRDSQAEDPSVSLDDYKFRRLESEIADLAQQLKERRDLHSIRRKHAWLLFALTVCWIVIIWLVVLLQGFGQWFIPFPAPALDEEYLKFSLSNTVSVAFMTSTTATVLGLYGIAAYWLYGKKPDEPKPKNESTDKESQDS